MSAKTAAFRRVLLTGMRVGKDLSVPTGDLWYGYWEGRRDAVKLSSETPPHAAEEIRLLYGASGIDLDKVAATAGISVDEIIKIDSASAEDLMSYAETVQMNAAAAVILEQDIFAGETPTLEELGIDPAETQVGFNVKAAVDGVRGLFGKVGGFIRRDPPNDGAQPNS